MKRWALLVVVLYAAVLGALICPLLLAAFGSEAIGVFRNPSPDSAVWILLCVGAFALVQTMLLVMPVRVAVGRPVSKRWIVWPILGTILATLGLGAGMLAAVIETVDNTKGMPKDCLTWGAIAVGTFWVIWAFVFGFYSGIGGPKNLMGRLAKTLVAGSIVELLVAIPAHILARSRGYCCAGFLTFTGLCMGIAVAIMAFGPALFVLFARRYASLKIPDSSRIQEPPEINSDNSKPAG